MNCKRLQTSLDAEAPPAEAPAEMRAHLAHCPACRRAWMLAHASVAILRELPAPPIPLGLAERLLASVADRRRPRITLWIWGPALAAALLLGIGIGVLFAPASLPPAGGYKLQDDTLMVPAGTVTVVRVALDAARPLHDVGFTVNVPPGIELKGHPSERQVAWRGALARGRNLLNLPLLAKPGAAGTLETVLHYGGRDTVFRMHIVALEEAPLHGLLRRWLARWRAG